MNYIYVSTVRPHDTLKFKYVLVRSKNNVMDNIT